MRTGGVVVAGVGAFCVLVGALAAISMVAYTTVLFDSVPGPVSGATALAPMNQTGVRVTYTASWDPSQTTILYSVDTTAVNPMSDGTVTQQTAVFDVTPSSSGCSITGQTVIAPGSNADYPPLQAQDTAHFEFPLCMSPSPPIYIQLDCTGAVPTAVDFSYIAEDSTYGLTCQVGELVLAALLGLSIFLTVGGCCCCLCCVFGVPICIMGGIMAVQPSRDQREYSHLVEAPPVNSINASAY